MTHNKRDIEMICSFCGKSEQEVKKLVAGGKVYICEECIILCSDIVKEELELPSP